MKELQSVDQFKVKFIISKQKYQQVNGSIPTRSGTVCGVVNGFGALSNFLVPLVKDWVVADDRSVADWRNLFLVAAGIAALGAGVFILLASTDVQGWKLWGLESQG